MTDETKYADQSDWEQRWEAQKGFPQASIRPGEYRSRALTQYAMIIFILTVIAIGTTVSAAMDVWARVDAERVQDAIEDAAGGEEGVDSELSGPTADEASSFDDCLASDLTTYDECSEEFPEGSS